MHQYHRCYWWWWVVGLLAVTTVCCSFSNHPSSSILVRAEEEQQDQCVDNHEKCPQWASQGECEINANYMLRECRFSCDNCHHEDDEDYLNDDGDDGDEYDDEDEDEEDDEEDPNEIFPRVVSSEDLARGTDLGIAQRLRGFPDDHDTWSADVSWMITKARSYMNHVVPRKFGDDMKQLCRNKDENCAYWALLGECEANPEYMKVNCAPVCGSCYNLTVESRCPLDRNEPNVWGPGDLNAMFERLVSEPYLSQYNVQVLSSPNNNNTGTTTDDEEERRPWVISMENVVTEEEAITLIELGHVMGYKRSTDVGARQADGTLGKKFSEGRTSTNAWCRDICDEDPIARRVYERLSNLTGIPERNSERLQLLRYEEGQFYNSHHDLIEAQVAMAAGPRVLTVFIYLNNVEAGGGTHFEELDLTVMPKRGRVVIWPSVYDENPTEKDWSTMHEALKVEKGIKYGANAWYHLRDYMTPSDKGCM